MGRALLILLALVVGGCTVRPAEKPSSSLDQAGVETVGREGPKTVPLDMAQAYIAEVQCGRNELGGKVRSLSPFDVHQKWTEEFVSDTVAQAKWLKKGERIEGSMVAHMGSDSAEVDISITRVDSETFAVRAVCSDETIHAALKVALGANKG